MASDNIREWGRKNGFDVGDEGRLPAGLRAAFDSRIQNDVETADDAAPEETDNAERAPAVVKATNVDRLRGLAARAKKPPAKARGAAKTRPRVNVDKVISQVWSLAAGMATNLNPCRRPPSWPCRPP
jgi:hypothetical protein